MDTVFKFLFEFLQQFFGSLWNGIVSILDMFNIPKYFEIVQNYTTTLGGLAWVIAIVAILLLVGVFGLIIFFIVKGILKLVKFKKKAKDTNDLVNEVNALNKEVMRLNLEKDKILSMKVSQIGLNPNEIADLTGEEMEALNKEEEEEEEGTGRFNKLVTIDEEWADYQPDPYDWDVTLPDFVTKADFDWAINEATLKKKTDFSKVEFFHYEEGRCVQCMHIGSYDMEPITIGKMKAYAAQEGLSINIDDVRRHHEIYLSDPRKTAIDKLKTVIRYPVK